MTADVLKVDFWAAVADIAVTYEFSGSRICDAYLNFSF
jgi:hypothetical protein